MTRLFFALLTLFFLSGPAMGQNSDFRRCTLAAKGITNPIPTRMARIVDTRFANSPTLGGPGATDVFVTAADDIAGISSSSGLAERLTLLDNAGNLRQGPFSIIEFDTPITGVASPVFRTNPGFIQGGYQVGVPASLRCQTYKSISYRM